MVRGLDEVKEKEVGVACNETKGGGGALFSVGKYC